MTDLPEAGTTTTGADLRRAVWVGAELEEVTLEDTPLTGLRAAGGTWTRSTVIGGDLSRSDLAGLQTSDCGLVRTTLDGARLTGSQWLRSRWRQVRGTDVVADCLAAHGSTWTDVELTDARLTELDLSEARLQRVRLVRCDLSRARFSGARCSDVTLVGCTLEGVVGIDGLRGASLAHGDAVSALPALAQHLGIRLIDDDDAA